MDKWKLPFCHEAELAKSYLEDQGIEAFVSADDMGGMRPSTGFTQGVRLMVTEPFISS